MIFLQFTNYISTSIKTITFACMSDKTKAILFILTSSLSFAIMSAMVKLAGDLPAHEKVFFRSSVSALVLFFWVKKQKLPLFGHRKNQGLLLLRSIFGTSAMFFFFYGLNHVYLADASIIGRLNPFFVTIFATVFLKEKLSRMQIPALVIVFFAATLIIKPRFDISVIPAAALFLGTMFSGGGHTILRGLRDKEKPTTVVFYFSFTSTLMLLPFTLSDFVIPTKEQWFYLIGIGLMAVVGQFSLTSAYRNWKASEISLYTYIGIIFSGILGFIFWDEIPDVLSIIGGIIIVFVSVMVFFIDKRKRNKEYTKLTIFGKQF